ncbi:MAG: hypothetical protein ABH814_02865 [bacterium]
MKIINQVKKEINFRFIALSALFELVFLVIAAVFGFLLYKNWPAIKDQFANYKVCGQVLEFGSEASIPDLRLNFESKHLYSLHDGSYCWDNLSFDSQPTLTLPKDYEADNTTTADYNIYKELSLFKRQVTHNFHLVLGVAGTANRIFDFQKQGALYSLWTYLTPDTRSNWSGKPDDFNKALITERTLRSRVDQSQIIDYRILESQPISDTLYQYKVEWVRANGTSFTQVETFEKIDNWWHYVFPRLPKEVYDYIYEAQKSLR